MQGMSVLVVAFPFERLRDEQSFRKYVDESRPVA
jgi:hypothetical protein